MMNCFSVPPVTPIPTLGPAIARLTSSLSALTTSHADSTATMASLAEERLQLEAREKEMRDMIEKAEAKRSWFAAFREWIENVATFLDEKVCQICSCPTWQC
jgi:GC-rich sequence DNA-binding factor